MRYHAEKRDDGNGWDVWFHNVLSNYEGTVWERVNAARAESLAAGGNALLRQVVATANPHHDMVRAFHLKFGHLAPDELEVPGAKMLSFRAKLITEEAGEAKDALAHLAEVPASQGALASVVQELCDILYVVHGTFVALGLRSDVYFEEVHRANLDKVPNPKGGKPLKPEGWRAPEVERLVGEGM